MDKTKAARHVRYGLGDPLLRFWFRFVFPHTSYLRHMGPERAWSDLIRPRLDAYFGLCFERLCREALPWLYLREGVSASFEVGEYWSKETQIDVVGLRDDGWTDLGECKWGSVASRRRVEQDLQQKMAAFPNRRNATLGGRVFVRQSRASGASGGSAVQWHTLEDLYADA